MGVLLRIFERGIIEILDGGSVDCFWFPRYGKEKMRSVFKYALDLMIKTDGNCPIILHKFTFNKFYHYISLSKSKR